MRVMGIDPGLTRCGLGVVDVDASRRASLVYVGVARTDKDLATHFLSLIHICLRKNVFSRGSSSPITASMPGFCNPTAFIIPAVDVYKRQPEGGALARNGGLPYLP